MRVGCPASHFPVSEAPRFLLQEMGRAKILEAQSQGSATFQATAGLAPGLEDFQNSLSQGERTDGRAPQGAGWGRGASSGRLSVCQAPRP